MSDFYLIAEIKSVYGNKGFVSVTSHTDFPDRFSKLNKVYIELFHDRKEFFVEEVKQKKSTLLIKFKNFNSDDDVEFLIGKKVFIEAEDVVPLSKDTFFIHDLIGSKVLRNGKYFGIIEDVLNLPANDIYVIKNLLDKEILIPAVKEFVLSFDVINKVLILQPGGKIYEDDED